MVEGHRRRLSDWPRWVSGDLVFCLRAHFRISGVLLGGVYRGDYGRVSVRFGCGRLVLAKLLPRGPEGVLEVNGQAFPMTSIDGCRGWCLLGRYTTLDVLN